MKKTASKAKKVVKSTAKKVTKAVTKTATKVVKKTKTVVNKAVKKAKTVVKKAKKTVKKVVKKAAKKVKSSKLYQKAKKTATKIKKKVCTKAKRIQKATVSFVKNVDWKKVATGALVAVAIAGAVALTGGAAAPVLIGAAQAGGMGALINGAVAAAQGGSIADITQAASEGFLWGAIGGDIAGGTAVMFNQAANAGSSLAGNYAVRQVIDVGTDTVLDTARAVARGEDVNAKTIGRDLLTNTLMAGAKAGGGNGKNGIADGPGKIKQGSGNHNRIEHINKEEGTFIIKDWSDYPDDYIPVPNKDKVWKLLKGDEYDKARTAANSVNRSIRSKDSHYSENRLEIHEIEPVKFGGSPTDQANKVAIQSQAHRKYVTPWWNKIQDELKE